MVVSYCNEWCSRLNRALVAIWAAILIAMLPNESIGQNTRLISDQQHGWLLLNGSIKLSNKFSVLYDFQFRRDDIVQNWQQFLLRAGLGYTLTENVQGVVGYCFVETYPYGDFPVANAFPEHRIWEQLQTKQSIGKIGLTHRFRLEQRMLGYAATGEFQPYRFENRIRYMCRWTFPLKSWEKHKLLLNVFDEIFINFGKNVAYNVFDQNRIAGTIGYSISPKITFEVGYLNQMVGLRSLTSDNKSRFENNHTITLGFTGNF